VEVTQLETLWERADERWTDGGDRQAFGEDEIGEVAFDRHPERERRGKGERRTRTRAFPLGQRQAAPSEALQPAIDQLTVSQRRGCGTTPENEPPALSRLRDDEPGSLGGRTGIGVHVC
jgi:hypothetical protein